MKKLKLILIKFLKIALKKLEQSITIDDNLSENSIDSLAPKIIKDQDQLKKIEPYITSISRALDTDSINNIAITGSYGSGKSTILKTFQFHNPEYQYLNLSLASFKDNKEDKEDFERRLEVSILQQMFYHVSPNEIPDSRFKRIINLTWKKLAIQTIFFILWITSVIILFKFDFIDKLNPEGWVYEYPFDWGSAFLILIFLTGVGFYVKSAIRLFSNSKISKFNIKGEVELNEATDKSVFNQHLEEILYFFERTKFDVVVIEDVDRFGSTDIFTKLREINILINNSNLVKRKVSFIYAIKDEMFTVSAERVKFFEFIIPVIPFINPSNASDQLTKLINSAELKDVLPAEFTDDVVTFIDDIDMRLLINIFHEYQIYRTSLSSELSQSNLFSIVVYKNMYPEDFGELPKRKGKLYKFLSGRSVYANVVKISLQEKINEIEALIEGIESETQTEIEELRAVYINLIISKLENFKSFYTDVEFTNIEALNDLNFIKLRGAKSIFYYKFDLINSYSKTYQVNGPNGSGITFKSIENEISDSTYEEREYNLISKSNGEKENLKKQLENLNAEIAEIDSYGIKEIFEKTEIDPYLEDFKESNLIRYLLLNGYINENYNDYISVFHAINLTHDDFNFEAKVKNGILMPYDYPLTNTKNVLERLQAKYFKRQSIWNYTLLNQILSSPERENTKRDYFFETLKADNEKSFEFISGYLSKEKETQSEFVRHLIMHKPNFWTYLNKKSNFTSEKVKEYCKIIFQYSEYENLVALEDIDTLNAYLENIDNFTEYVSSFSNTQLILQFVNDKRIKIKQLDLPFESPNNVFDFIYENGAYQITPDNIKVILKYSAVEFDEDRFKTANYTLLKEFAPEQLMSYLHANIQTYVQSTFDIKENSNESEESLTELINNPYLEESHKVKILQNQGNKISDLANINSKEDKALILKFNLVDTSWNNVYDYFSATGDSGLDDVLAEYLGLESNYEQLSKIQIDNIDIDNEDLAMEFCEVIIYTDKLSIEANTALLKSIPFSYDSLDYSRIVKAKSKAMIENESINLTTESFEGLKAEYNDLHISLLEKREEEFIENFGSFNLDAADFELLFKSSVFTLSGKNNIIDQVDDNIIINNANIAELVCYLIPEEKKTSLRYEVFEAMFNSNAKLSRKIKMLNLNHERFDNDQLQRLVESFGDDYIRLFAKQNKPVFANKSYNQNLFEILKSRDLISSFSINNNDEIKVVANY